MRTLANKGIFSLSLSLSVPASILYKSIAGRYRPVRVADGPITARYRCIKMLTCVCVCVRVCVCVCVMNKWALSLKKHIKTIIYASGQSDQCRAEHLQNPWLVYSMLINGGPDQIVQAGLGLSSSHITQSPFSHIVTQMSFIWVGPSQWCSVHFFM